jgi:hypothetical protein
VIDYYIKFQDYFSIIDAMSDKQQQIESLNSEVCDIRDEYLIDLSFAGFRSKFYKKN